MKILVTGAAGFIGSHLCERLLEINDVEVIGIDGFIIPSLNQTKLRNLRFLLTNPRFAFHQVDLRQTDLKQLLEGVDVIYHLAAIPGVRTSWGSDFQLYVDHNIVATQLLLEVVRECPVSKFIYISTSSVYGEKAGKVAETSIPTPLSPYGVSKLTGEYLCKVYQESYGIPIVILRYFTVFGPRQRSDMAFHRFIKGIIKGEPIQIYGNGLQTRDFTYVKDCVEATVSALDAKDVIGEVINIGGFERASILEVISMLENLLKQKATLEFMDRQNGDPLNTWADISKAQRLLNYTPECSLQEGLKQQTIDICKNYL
ncbi:MULTISPECIES: NAD(P)-dependent oxidoreductase [Desulfitobacterium]|uniref:Nucleoside-diphosphate-sugar epimerase n=1 Tax=Desulfitobacterium dehalogenans (strain ATCC 51507 / DSM 9161 / JW/IU-DC1) TaxID=756499 RepID=I4A848_DESDJ|nr:MULTISPECIES: NAD-dependent epimerase/dehydratase family protein [Desulfitobacterium]AFM00133.1 nucleoside-diphosphate-sugar epimerase [Desulfitobacterium dehalogenans ATCC 51507]